MKPVGADHLCWLAREASRNAYCRYSNFPVGAALVTASGIIYTGCNVENASFGLTICAERNAVFQAVASGHREVTAVAVYVSGDAPASPCGACRQVLSEFMPQTGGMTVYLCCDTDEVVETTLDDLLPMRFSL
ncbi:MAG: cytidine deaminase [Acidobacteriota bacterium]